MDNFRVIYRILKILEQSLDCEEFDYERITPEALKISETRWCGIMEMLADEGYVKGIHISRSVDGMVTVSRCNIRITLKGLEYLNENSFMKKAGNIAKGISDLIP